MRRAQININRILMLISAVALVWVGYKLWSFAEWGAFLDYLKTNQQQLPALLMLQFSLMGLNLALETRKWQILARPVRFISFREAFVQVLKGIQLGMVTPARTGDPIGKSVFYPSGEKSKIIVLSLIGSIIQNFVILFAAIWALLWTTHSAGDYLTLLVNSTASSSLLLPLTVISGLILALWLILKRMRYFTVFLSLVKTRLDMIKQTKKSAILHVLLLTTIRYSVFSFQFLILLHFFGLNDIRNGLYAIFIFYGALSFIPSAGAGDLSIRATLAIMIFGSTAVAEPGIVMSSLVLWFFNLALPALMPSVILAATSFHPKLQKFFLRI
ncbi:hypothetical protein [Marinilabilia sp.]|uniref:hypothetical protein n=1 Tax=Marinilabilia sp. TaxID=2021252 RepID=UPI0025BF3F6E|nr:hypothetical protein [Marinilabilia sp.]